MALCLLSLFIRKMIVMDSIICRSSNLATTLKKRLQRGRIGARTMSQAPQRSQQWHEAQK